jgi:probable rRNA maturation factor
LYLGKEITIQDKSNIWVNNYHPSIKLPLSKKSILNLIYSVFIDENIRNIEIIINFVTRGIIRQINKNYLNHNCVTDVITFPYQVGGKFIDGEIFISLDRVRINAKEFNIKYSEEIKRVIVHGCLHLLGYDDKIEKLRMEMKKKENFYLYNYSNVLRKNY